jgi:hypothetical protein
MLIEGDGNYPMVELIIEVFSARAPSVPQEIQKSPID